MKLKIDITPVDCVEHHHTPSLVSNEEECEYELQVDYIVSRHPASIKLMQEDFPHAKVLDHADPLTIYNKVVVGTLPIHLAAKCRYFINLSLDIPREERGNEFSLEDLERFNKRYEIYCVLKSRVDL